MVEDVGLVLYKSNGIPYGVRCVLAENAMHLGKVGWKYFRFDRPSISNVESGGLFRKELKLTVGKQEHTLGMSRTQVRHVMSWLND